MKANSYHVKKSKELGDNNLSNTDWKYSKTITMLVKGGQYMDPYLPEGVYKDRKYVGT